MARVELDRELALAARRERERAADRLEQRLVLLSVEEVRGAAAEVELHDLAVGVEQLALQRDFPVQPREIGLAPGAIARDDPVAATVEARACAEWHVQVERERPRDRVVVGGERLRAVVTLAESGLEVRRGRIRGVARPTLVVAREQLGVELEVVAGRDPRAGRRGGGGGGRRSLQRRGNRHGVHRRLRGHAAHRLRFAARPH
jgi:hypothetical protein